MDVIAVTRKLWVMGQPSTGDFVTLKQRGFATVINNRPDGEAPDQPGSKAEELAAREAGLAYIHLPVTSTGITKEDARRFQEARSMPRTGQSSRTAARARAPSSFGS